MTHVITQPCIGTKDASCVDACPVNNCIREVDEQFFIDPNLCIDCGACVPACPVEATMAETDVPTKWQEFIEKNRKLAALNG